METFLSFLIMLFFVGLFLAAFLVTGGGVLVVLGKLFNRIVSYWEQSFRYPLWLRTEKKYLDLAVYCGCRLFIFSSIVCRYECCRSFNAVK